MPAFPDDDGRPALGVAEALADHAEGRAGEYAVLTALAGTRLLVPVVAVLTEEEERPDGSSEEKNSEMALPTLIGADGRRGLLAFTGMDALRRWRADARPVAVHVREACRAAVDEGADAVVIDVAGPASFAVDGSRLRALAHDGAVVPPHQDPDVLAAVDAALRSVPGATDVLVGPGENTELSIRFRVIAGGDERAAVRGVADRLTEQLRGRIVGGVELGAVRR